MFQKVQSSLDHKKAMSWTLPKDSSRMSSHPRSITWILVSVGGLAVFLIFASWVLISYPIGTALQGYFYGVGVDSTERLDVSVSPINNTIIDIHINETLDPVDNNASSDLQSPTVSIGRSSEDNIENTVTKSISQVPFRESSSQNLPKIKEVDDLETSDIAASESPKPMNLLGNSTDTVSNSELSNFKSQVNSTLALPVPAASLESVRELEVKDGIYASNADGNSTIDEPVSVSSINKSSAASMTVDHTSLSSSGSTSSPPASLDVPKNASFSGSADSGCDLYHGNWIYDPLGPLYTNNSCPVLTQMQNCQGNGRPDKDYENWRWKPFQCDLPRFDPKKFLELMRGKTLAFIGDSVARNQMESLLCILWQVEVPKNRGNRNMQRYYFRSSSVMIVRIWSSWLVKQVSDPFDFAPAGVAKLHLDVPEEKLMEYIPTFDVVVLSSGHWFAKQSVYILNNTIVGGQLWWPDQSRSVKIDSTEAYAISVDTILTALVTHPNYTGLTIVRSYSPDHYEGGAWNTGGSCTGKVKPLAADELVENGHINTMHEKQVRGFNRAIKKATNRSKLRLMDITQAFQYRHDGHPGPYRSPDPNKITKRGPDGRPPPQDCLHWCMPGPVDTWNELVLEIIRRESEGGSSP